MVWVTVGAGGGSMKQSAEVKASVKLWGLKLWGVANKIGRGVSMGQMLLVCPIPMLWAYRMLTPSSHLGLGRHIQSQQPVNSPSRQVVKSSSRFSNFQITCVSSGLATLGSLHRHEHIPTKNVSTMVEPWTINSTAYP